MNREDLVVGSIVWHPQYGRVTVERLPHPADSMVRVRDGGRLSLPLLVKPEHLEPAIPFDPEDTPDRITSTDMLVAYAAAYADARSLYDRLWNLDRHTRKLARMHDRERGVKTTATTIEAAQDAARLTKAIESAILQLSLLDPTASVYIGPKEGE